VTKDARLKILVLDRNRRNLMLLTEFLGKHGYTVLPKISLEEVAQTLDETPKISLVLIDISGFDAAVWNLCQQLRDREIPFLVISPSQHAEIQQASIVHGAMGLLGKPLVMREFLNLIQGILGRNG
jgi:DNA-binding response OmpR family regulator